MNFLLWDHNLNSKIAVSPIVYILPSVFIVFLTPLDIKDTFIYKYFSSPIFKSTVLNTLLLSIIFPTFVALRIIFLSHAYA